MRMQLRLTLAVTILVLGSVGVAPAQDVAPSFSIGDVQSAPLPSGLTASPEGNRVAWVHNAEGIRNVWVASAPEWEARRLTSYEVRDGQPIGDLAFTPNGHRLVFVRGANPNSAGVIANPTSDPDGQTRAIYVVPVSDEAAEPRMLGEGSDPVIAPSGERVAFEKDGDIWFVGLGEEAEPEAAIEARGGEGDLVWSPNGGYLAFVSGREEHSYIGVYDPAADTLDFLAPSVDGDFSPSWSPDGTRIAWVRTASEPTELPFTPERTVAEPWSIQIHSLDSGRTREVWSAGEGYGSAFRGIDAESQILWTTNDRLVFPWEKTGWVHLYSIPASGGEATELTPGEGFVQDVALAPDRASVIYSTNHDDIDRRHLWRVDGDGSAAPEPVTTGGGIEWAPTPLADGGLAFFASTARTPAHAEITSLMSDGGERQWLAPETLPEQFPQNDLVEPRQVIFSAADGKRIHGQLFLPPGVEAGEAADRPAVVFMHGGSRRQMLLGWHYRGYYHRAYGMNQWLASKGYVVLSVNYRSGIGYGLEFREAIDYGAAGASEFQDIRGAGLFLRKRPEVDGDRIGLWGGSYGGYLTALGLARASDLFAAGVDFHGVHNWNVVIENFVPDYRPSVRTAFRERAFEASPMADADEWRSPVLFVHGDDDRNVPFTETVRMIAELRRHDQAEIEQLVFADEVHGFLLHESWLKAYRQAGDFFDRKLRDSDR